MSHFPPGGMSPSRILAMAALSFADPGEDRGSAVVLGLQSLPFSFPGRAKLAEERLGVLCVLGPDGPVAGMMGGLRAAGRVAHSDEGLFAGRGGGGGAAEGP